MVQAMFFFFFSSRRRHTIFDCDWSSDVCSSDLSNLLGFTNILEGCRHVGAKHLVFASSSSDRKSTRLNSSHSQISYAVFCLKKKKKSMCFPHQVDHQVAHLACHYNHSTASTRGR